ncbi:hypothetical protein [Riemerella columbipharyngis]|uniref:Uncharacterized protein n=1 Tax=Riemerella columbipharyngis TaxID=1071918 RepID=A0A1G7FSG2_9FLAO|nr:hypothetical protein [Riemerella columbipharyngis]SDE78828.1 hypothetical protein SAMN05421544_1271 [Riemerella columbipharyngis]
MKKWNILLIVTAVLLVLSIVFKANILVVLSLVCSMIVFLLQLFNKKKTQ